MAINKPSEIPEQYNLSSKWDACLDLSVRRVFYHTLTGAFAGLLLFRSPVTRWASAAFGAGVGIGAAYTECSYKFGSPVPKPAVEVPDLPVPTLEAFGEEHLVT